MGADKKEAKGPKPEAGQSSGATGGGPTHCTCQDCKKSVSRFSFCDEHYEHFKFGLITKMGKPVSDYEKKFEHYRAYVARRGAQKVA